MKWQPIDTAPETMDLLIGYEPGPLGPAVYGMVRGPLGGWKWAEDMEQEVSPTHWTTIPELPV